MDIQSSPFATLIFVVTIGISLLCLYGKNNLYERLLLHPWSIAKKNTWYMFITSGFVHADIPHLMFNMLSFMFFAFTLEQIIGSLYFVIIYFISLILSNVSTVIKHRNDFGYRAVGASGAISGVLFSYILFEPTSKIMVFFIPIGIPAPIFALLYLAYCFFAAKKAADSINHEAHLWGALAGLILTIILIPDILPYFIHKVF
ncbi:MAG: rhomboid family intramembrane serine protease [FCB group bacterium]|jgi:membrane associated rhomboid family serine protease